MKPFTTNVPAKSQAEKSLRELRSRIIAGEFPANTKLREVPLSEALGVSRTPLRAALQSLQQEGLLERIGGGYTVSAFSFQDAIIAIELRGVIEGTAARLAAERPDVKHHLAAIKKTVAKLDVVVQQEFIDGYGELNQLFHQQLSALAGNKIIEREVARASRLPFASPSAFTTTKQDINRFKTSVIVGQQHHHALIESIERGESARAESLAREHAHLAKTNIEVAYRDRAEKNHEAPLLALITRTT